jgi:plasmid stabilization system protein ParE
MNKADTLLLNPLKGPKELFLEYLGLGDRRLIEGKYKIIYSVVGEDIYIIDIFDTRQHPVKMKG